jgi:hypothetical protein
VTERERERVKLLLMLLLKAGVVEHSSGARNGWHTGQRSVFAELVAVAINSRARNYA